MWLLWNLLWQTARVDFTLADSSPDPYTTLPFPAMDKAIFIVHLLLAMFRKSYLQGGFYYG